MNTHSDTIAPTVSATELVKRLYPGMTSASDEIEIVVDLIRPIRHALRADLGFVDEKDFRSFACTLDAVVDALVDVRQRVPRSGGAAGQAAASQPPAIDQPDQPTNIKGLMAALSVELMRWNGGGHRAIVYPAGNEQRSCLQDLLLMPEEPGARPGSPSMVARKIATAQDNLLEAQSLNVAVMLATEDLSDSAAIHAVARAVEAKINLVRDQLEAIREALS